MLLFRFFKGGGDAEPSWRQSKAFKEMVLYVGQMFSYCDKLLQRGPS
jgi:hypothetical protein